MKRFLLVLLVAIIAIPAFQSCKKGENDPALSLVSRNARITAEWKLTGIEATRTRVAGGNTVVTTLSYDGSILTMTQGGVSVTATGSYTMTIEKWGKMSWSETYTVGGNTDVQTATGYWEWVDSDKNKSYVILEGGDHLFTGGLCRIDRLASKELVIIDEGNANDNGDTDVWSYKYTFEKQK